MKMVNNKIYGIRRYLHLEDMFLGNKYGDVVYVGKTNKDINIRLAQHRVDKTHFEKTEWLMKNEHEIFILEENILDWNVAEREQYWILQFATASKLNRIRAKKPTFSDGLSAIQRAKKRIKDLKKNGY